MIQSTSADWWVQYKEYMPEKFYDFIIDEFNASKIGSVEIDNIPGLLQTEKYMHAVTDSCFDHRLAEDLVRKTIELRLERQWRILSKKPEVQLTFVIDESALLRIYGSKRTQIEQLEHLIKMADEPNIKIQIAALDEVQLIGAARHQYFILDLGDSKKFYRERHTAELFESIDSQHETDWIQAHFAYMQHQALNPEQSIDCINDAIHRISQIKPRKR